MGREFFGLGSTPPEEPCVQVNPNVDYEQDMFAEAKRFRDLIVQKCGEPPSGASVAIKWENHDFGRYTDVGVKFDPNDPVQSQYAYFVDENCPLTWQDSHMPENFWQYRERKKREGILE